MFHKRLTTVVLCTAVMAFVPFASVQAATVGPYSCALPRARTDWNKNCVFQQFNPALGTLQNIAITVNGNIITTLKVENLDSVAHTITTTLNGSIIVNRPNATQLSLLPITRSTVDAFTLFDGVEDYGGTSGKSYNDLSSGNSKTDTITSATDLALFSGTGNVTVPVIAQASSTATGSGNVESRHTTDAEANVSIVYTYTPAPTATPTPTVVNPSVTPTSVPPTSTPGGSPVCNDAKPSCRPDLFQIDTGANYAKLYINPCNDMCGKMLVRYGRTDAADEYSVEIDRTSSGVMSYTINSLGANTKYYFKIKCLNGCTSGDYGDVLGATTSDCVTAYYRTGAPQKTSACGTGGSETQGQVQGTSTSGQVLGTSTGSVLAAAGNPLIWITAVVGSALIAFVVTLKTSSFSAGFKSRRR